MTEIVMYVGKPFIEALKLCGLLALAGTIVIWFIRTAFVPCLPNGVDEK